MAYVFGFGKDVTSLLYSFRDFKFEDTKRKEGTPSRLALKPYTIHNRVDWPGGGRDYLINVKSRTSNHWVLCLEDNRWFQSCGKRWSSFHCLHSNYRVATAHGLQVRVVEDESESDESESDESEDSDG